MNMPQNRQHKHDYIMTSYRSGVYRCRMCGKIARSNTISSHLHDPSGIKAFDFIQENKRGYLN